MPDENNRKLKDANFCIGTGVGVGLLGAGSAAVMGAVCPICVFVTPLLIGAGLIQRIRVKKQVTTDNQAEAKPEAAE